VGSECYEQVFTDGKDEGEDVVTAAAARGGAADVDLFDDWPHGGSSNEITNFTSRSA
jgi:hypothetical protein